MFGEGQAFEGAVLAQLAEIAFIDGEDERWAAERAALEKDGWSGERGCWGVLAATNRGDCTEAIASIYARIAARLGVFEVERRLDAREWSDASACAEAWAREQPRRRGDVETRWGAPSYRGKGARPRVLAYAGPTDDAWLYFDLTDDDEVAFVRVPAAKRTRSIVDLRSPSIETGPEDAFRAFRSALLTGDEQQLRAVIVAHPDPSVLWQGRYPAGVARQLAGQDVAVSRVAAPEDVVYLESDDLPITFAVVNDGEGWRVDADPLVAMWTTRN